MKVFLVVRNSVFSGKEVIEGIYSDKQFAEKKVNELKYYFNFESWILEKENNEGVKEYEC